LRKVKVEGHRNLYRDKDTGAIVNCDTEAYNSYIKSRDSKKLQKKEIQELRDEIDELKNMLKRFLDK
jgi:ribonuclease HII